MATRDELQRARAALEHAAARLCEVAAQGLDEHPTEEELAHADAYAATAAMMRRRAARLRAGGNEEHAAHELERAELFDARAEAKRAGRPMPRRLRTPAESLARVDGFRQSLARLVDDFADLGPDEWGAFASALRSASEARATLAHREAFAALEGLLSALGVEPGEEERRYVPFASPLEPMGDSPVRARDARSGG